MLKMASKVSSKIVQFINITGASEEAARTLLNACEGNLELAVGMYMEDGASTVASETHSSSVPILLVVPCGVLRTLV